MATKIRKTSIRNKEFWVTEVREELPDLKPFGLYMDGDLLCTPSGKPITADSPQGLRAMAAELEFNDRLDATINLYLLYSTQKEFVESGENCICRPIKEIVAGDPVLATCAGPEQIYQLRYLPPVIDYLKQNSQSFPSFPQVPAEFILENHWNAQRDALAVFIDFEIRALSPAKMSVLLTMLSRYGSVVLALLLVKGSISPGEFACLHILSLCLYSKGFGDVSRRKEKNLYASVTRTAATAKIYIELFD